MGVGRIPQNLQQDLSFPNARNGFNGKEVGTGILEQLPSGFVKGTKL